MADIRLHESWRTPLAGVAFATLFVSARASAQGATGTVAGLVTAAIVLAAHSAEADDARSAQRAAVAAWAFAGFAVLAEGRPILLVGCWMHARRYFVKALEAKDVRAAEPLQLIGKIYEVERASKEAGDSHQQRYERRQRDMVPLLDELERWKDENAGVVPPNEPLGRAWTYLRNHWDILAVVVQDGALELDNGEVERVIRGPALGRRNWLFAGSDEGAERAATILTVLETAKRAGVDIREYLRDVLWKVAGGWKQARLDELLPHVWAAARRESAAATDDVELGTSVG